MVSRRRIGLSRNSWAPSREVLVLLHAGLRYGSALNSLENSTVGHYAELANEATPTGQRRMLGP